MPARTPVCGQESPGTDTGSVPAGRGHRHWEKVEPSAPAGSNPPAVAWHCLAPQEARAQGFLAQSQVANPNFTLSSGQPLPCRTPGGLPRVVKKLTHLLLVHSWPQRREKLIDKKRSLKCIKHLLYTSLFHAHYLPLTIRKGMRGSGDHPHIMCINKKL